MNIEFLKNPCFGTGISVSEEAIGVKYWYTDSKSLITGHIYRVINKKLFFLSVIKYGLEFNEIE